MDGLRRIWWLLAVRGVLALAVGLIAIFSRVTLGAIAWGSPSSTSHLAEGVERP